MSHRSTHLLALALSAGAIALLPSCGGGDADAAGPSVPAEFESSFEVESPLRVVAGDGQAWILSEDGDAASLSRVDHTGRSTEVVRLTGQSIHMAPFRGGVVVAQVACAGEGCQETTTEVLVLDGEGSTVAEGELGDEPGSPERSDGAQVFGFHENVVYIDTSGAGLVGFDVETGKPDTREPSDVPLRRYDQVPGQLADESATVAAECVPGGDGSATARCTISAA